MNAARLAETRKLNLSTRDVADALRSIDERDAAVIARHLNIGNATAAGLEIVKLVAAFIDDDSEVVALAQACRA